MPRLWQPVQAVDPGGRVEDWLAMGRDVAEEIHGLTDTIQVPMSRGDLDVRIPAHGSRPAQRGVPIRARGRDRPELREEAPRPFGEYVPLLETFPWVLALTPYHRKRIPA